MKVIFRSKDFASVESAGYGFNNRRPGISSWQYLGRVQHRQWEGTYECVWETAASAGGAVPAELIWTVTGDARLFGLAAALKSRGFPVDVAQN
ncbi:MAG TPA: hypothetical protein VL485_04980 [Ktedonobacteraceae bacterium]|jgi:hypothetical protein|nr:hypothetical protein [Ktedonobacteraceae bacterium]